MRGVWVCLLVGMLLVSACQGPPRVETVDHVQVMMPLGPVDIEGTPGPDGLQVRVFLYQGKDAQTVLGNGQLELRLYDGRLLPQEDLPQPLKTWTFKPEALMERADKTLGLWNYQITLLWQEHAPTQPIATVLAIYTAPNGQQVVSAPVQMSVR